MKIHLKIIILAALILTCLTPQACQTPAGRSAGEVVDDSTITTKVKAKIFADSILSGFSISVKTFQGEVTLTGAVKTSEQRQQAADIARSVTGVRKINNLLKVK